MDNTKTLPQLPITNVHDLQQGLQWLNEVITTRIQLYFGKESPYSRIQDIPVPDVGNSRSTYAHVIRHYRISIEEQLVLLLALAPHIYPQMLDVFFTKNSLYDRGFTEFGGVKGQGFSGFLPTGETAVFLLGNNDLSTRFRVMSVFNENHVFYRYNILSLDNRHPSEPLLSGQLRLSAEYLHYLTMGNEYIPKFTSEFPAQRITTKLERSDLVLNDDVLLDIEEIITWIQHHKTIMQTWRLDKHLKPGYRCLFYGPPGTGKTLTASIIGKETQRPVYRVDLSKIISKYIGETEKNLAKIFDQAENKEWILFFDEADALFGKRSVTNDAKDRYANQEIAYLLQRIEDFPGVIILATNLKGNLDAAFSRRFQNITYFPMPKVNQRYQLWKNAFATLNVSQQVSFRKIAKDYEIAGGSIINVLRYCALSIVNQEVPLVSEVDIVDGIKREFRKDGRTV